ncbi:hypothetical protein AAFG13_37170 [Bradyrhizobium sp. B124]|uniref:hypothetical protein n=1 Tax=Bradyrhizobium sp. B124 TaxID=3140245 RepID=UPI0031833C05
MVTMAVQSLAVRRHAAADPLQRIERRRKMKAFTVFLPLLLFILIAFVLPIGRMLFNAMHDDTLLMLMPQTTAAASV